MGEITRRRRVAAAATAAGEISRNAAHGKWLNGNRWWLVGRVTRGVDRRARGRATARFRGPGGATKANNTRRAPVPVPVGRLRAKRHLLKAHVIHIYVNKYLYIYTVHPSRHPRRGDCVNNARDGELCETVGERAGNRRVARVRSPPPPPFLLAFNYGPALRFNWNEIKPPRLPPPRPPPLRSRACKHGRQTRTRLYPPPPSSLTRCFVSTRPQSLLRFFTAVVKSTTKLGIN